ncbi:MAG: hypothetical protein HFJ25_05510 [Clostridia bacterium]|nr:hypothetical protein [Clostridia bacterium]
MNMKGKAGVAPFLKKNDPSSVDMDGVGPFTCEMAPVFAVVHPVSLRPSHSTLVALRQEVENEDEVLEDEETAGSIEEDIAGEDEFLETELTDEELENLFTEDGVEPRELQSMEEEVACLHRDIHFIVNDFLPLGCAVLIVSLGCCWFYRTFCR